MSRSNSVSPTPFEALITDLGHDGRGVARIDGKTVFVSGALLGEQVTARLRKRHRHFDEAEVVEVITASPHRVHTSAATCLTTTTLDPTTKGSVVRAGLSLPPQK